MASSAAAGVPSLRSYLLLPLVAPGKGRDAGQTTRGRGRVENRRSKRALYQILEGEAAVEAIERGTVNGTSKSPAARLSPAKDWNTHWTPI